MLLINCIYVYMPTNAGPGAIAPFNTTLPPVIPVARSILQLGQPEY